MSQELLQEINLGSARGTHARQPAAPVKIEVVRALTADDLPMIQAPAPVGGPIQCVKNLRYSHHRLAELIAKGMSGGEVSLATGYSPSYISTIQRDPAFAELVAYYTTQTRALFADSLERLKSLGLDATEKLQDMLHDETVVWTKRELMELTELGLLGPMTAANGKNVPQPGASANLSLEVKFVGATPRGQQPVVEATFTEVPDRG